MGKFKRVPVDVAVSDLTPLNISCRTTKCESGLHCFSKYMKKAEKQFGKKGVCYVCGDASIDWSRIHKQDVSDSKFIFESLNKELIRKIFSIIEIEKAALDSAKLKNFEELKDYAKEVLKKRIGKYNAYIDGRQTPMGKDDIVNYAQHATGTCCRQCLHAWYNIPKQLELTKIQLEFCTDLVMFYIEERLSNLPVEKFVEK